MTPTNLIVTKVKHKLLKPYTFLHNWFLRPLTNLQKNKKKAIIDFNQLIFVFIVEIPIYFLMLLCFKVFFYKQETVKKLAETSETRYILII